MKDKIIEILIETRPEFDFKQETENFIAGGLLDSFDIISIVSDLEEVFEISIDGDQILPDNFDSVIAIETLVEKSKNK